VAEIFSTPFINISWRRNLIGNKLAAWNNLVPRIANLVLSQEQHEFYWNLHPSGQFSVKSHYLAMIHVDVPNLNKSPLKIKIFVWYLWRGVVLIKDNLIKHNWKED
jgi:hypothetical protein